MSIETPTPDDWCKCGHKRKTHPDDGPCASLNCACADQLVQRVSDSTQIDGYRREPAGFTWSTTFNRDARNPA